jgi:uncharacterized protein (DUF488 family)
MSISKEFLATSFNEVHSTEQIPILTVGYGSRSVDQFILLLQRYSIEFLGDVRSRPYSRFRPEFSREQLRRRLAREGVRYVYLGETLGGQPQDPDCYSSGRVDYAKVRERPFYQAGLARLETASQKQLRLALMCSEGQPALCHRTKLIGKSLVERAIPIMHIDEGGELRSQSDIMRALSNGQISLDGVATSATLSRRRYRDGTD